MKLTTLLVALVLAGCATVPAIDASRIPAAPVQFKEGDGRWTVAKAAEAQPRGEWWKAFADPVLHDLVARPDRSNATIQQAAARLAHARAIARATHADRAPQVGVEPGVQPLRGLGTGPTGPAHPFR